MASPESYSPYTEAFKDKVVEDFNKTFGLLGVSVSRAAQQTANAYGIARTTVIAWAKDRERMPEPTWGMIYAKDDEIAVLQARVAELEANVKQLYREGSRP